MFCKNCGKKIDDDSKFCIFCGTPHNTNKQEINNTNIDVQNVDNQEVKSNNEVNQNVNNYKNIEICSSNEILKEPNSQNIKTNPKDLSIIEKIVISIGLGVFVLTLLLSACISFIDDTNNSNTVINEQKTDKKIEKVDNSIETSAKNNSDNINNSKTTKISQEQKQKRLDTINNLINEGKNGGLIIDIEKFHDDVFDKDGGYIVVEESLWNQLPHETKKELCYMAEEYTQLTGIEIVGFKGYRTGKKMMPLPSTIHNF